MSPEQKGCDPKTPLTGMSGRESVFDRRLREYRNTGGFAKPQRNTIDYIKKPTKEFETPSMDSVLHASQAETEEYTETERLAFLDESSSLLNARTITAGVARELRRSNRYKHDFSIMVVELDGFANMQALTPLAVEMIFLSFSKILTKNTREVDIVGRFDKSSVLIICPETNLNEAAAEAQRLREVIESTRFKQMGYHNSLTVSIGVASFPTHGSTHVEVLGAGMVAAQEAVAAGGNTVCACPGVFVASPKTAVTEDFSPAGDFSPDNKEEAPVEDMSPTANKPAHELAFPTVDVSPIIT